MSRTRLRRLAVVNRGEAAMRCIRAVKSLRAQEGSHLEVVALYTEPDRDAPFVRHADRAVLLPSADGAVAAYLDHERLLAALDEAEANAVWPGWGFVAEDARFVEALSQRGIVFLGPPASAMRAVGDKIAAKQLAESADVPVTAWSGGVLRDPEHAKQCAEAIGFPLVIKASAGGGGRGIRVVRDASEIESAFASASSEAEGAFGDGRLFCEAMVVGGRHIEVQIAADQHGNAIALGCRDCSVQRRHQKVLEEAPPPDLERELRDAIEASAVRLAQAVSYVGVGTVEFLVAGDAFYFLEVNPRLQVEHGITEEITGVDLVQLQIRIARGESIKSVSVRERGVAIEARVCAEDPDANFLPAPGRIARFEPSLGPRVRIDSGVAAGSTVPPDFDSLVAKVIATGDTREEAIARLSAALRDFEIVVEGGATTKGYLLELLDTDDYRSGPVDTTWLDRWNTLRESEAEADVSISRDALVAAAIIAYQRVRRQVREYFYADSTAITADRIPPSKGLQVDLSCEGESYRVTVYAIGAWRYRIHMDGRMLAATMREEGAHAARLIVDDRVRRILYDTTEQGLRLEIDGDPRRFGWQTAGKVTAGSPAMVVSIDVAEGDRVISGQLLGFIEAMKTEIGFHAPVSGVVTEVRARRGQQVGAGEVLLVIDPSAGEDESESTARERIVLPPQRDPLAPLFRPAGDEALAKPDLETAARATGEALEQRREAIGAVREEIRRALLGYDVNPGRAKSLIAFLEAPLTDALTPDFLNDLAAIRAELTTFEEIERLFIRAPRASVSGELGPSNNARLRTYIRRVREAGAGLPEEFLELLRAGLVHYGVADLAPSDQLERALLRMLSTQFGPDLRRELVMGLVLRITQLAEAGVDMSGDEKLRAALAEIARMRGLLSDAVADAALEADYVVFEKPAVERAAEQSSKDLEAWLAEAAIRPTAPSANVLLEVAAAARRVFDRVGSWVAAPDPGRRQIALAAHVQRAYAPRIPAGHSSLKVEGTWVHCVDYEGFGLVAAASASGESLVTVVTRLCEAAKRIVAREGPNRLISLELLVPEGAAIADDELAARVEPVLASADVPCPMTVAFMTATGDYAYKTIAPVSGGFVLRRDLYDIHPEAAKRIHLQRLAAFELERIESEEGIYAFYGRAREVPGDERVFVLADARDRRPLAGPEVEHHLPAFERVFYRCTRTLRTILQLRDPRRRLQWNRISIVVAPDILLDERMAGIVAHRLAPATRHLGLEKVCVTLHVLDPENITAGARPTEVVISDIGPQMEISWREPHHDPLQPAQDYERKVVAARRRRLVYPYEIIKTLSSGDRSLGSGVQGAESLPAGEFEEYDLAEGAEKPTAVSVAGRPHGQNKASVVFGVITTPTEKVPEGMKRVLVLSDPTMGMGSLSIGECDRIVAALDLAESLDVPLEWVPVSSGAKIAMDSGTENLDATARVVRRIVTFTQAGGVIHLIVQGVNVGAQSYFDALATMLMHTKGVLIMTPRASMVLTGRAALEASGAVAAEDEVAIGGFERIMGPNGEAQYYARSLAEAYRILYDYYRYSYVVPGEKGPRRGESHDPVFRSVCDTPLRESEGSEFATVGEIFDDETNPGRKKPFPMRAVMAATVDQDGGHLERWYSMHAGETAIVWDAHLGGVPATVIGIESQSIPREGYRPFDGPESWTGGTLFPYSSKKVARAINSASGNRPVVVLANLSGFDGSPESLRQLQLEYGAEIARAVVNFEGPLLFVVVSRYHGGAYVVFSQSLNPSLSASALTGSYASVIGGGPAAAVVFAREVRARALADPRVVENQARSGDSGKSREAFDLLLKEVTLEKQAELASEFDQIHSVERARQVGSLTRIVEPARMREEIVAELCEALGEPARGAPRAAK